MKRRFILLTVLSVGLLMTLGLISVAQSGAPTDAPGDDPALMVWSTSLDPLGSEFTYQGRLSRDGNPVNDSCNFSFLLFDAAIDGNQVGPVQDRPLVLVTEGYFSVFLDFGVDSFNGDARWLEVSTMCPGDSGPVVLGRHAFTAAPQSMYAMTAPWSGLSDIPGDIADGDDDTTYSDGEGLNLSGYEFSIDFGGSGSVATVSRSDHGHSGETWTVADGNALELVGDVGLESYGREVGLIGYSDDYDGSGIWGIAGSNGGDTFGVLGVNYSMSGVGVAGESNTDSGHTTGVWGVDHSSEGIGVTGYNKSLDGETIGVLGRSDSTAGTGVFGLADAPTGETYGVYGTSNSPDGNGGYFRNSSSGVALYGITMSGTGNIIEGWSNFADREFHVERGGTVRADGAFIGGGADYAELLSGSNGLEPGDVLVIGPDGLLTRSSQSFQPTVVGVYSSQPGFLAGGGDESSDLSGKIPLAVMGVVSVNVSVENGPIQVGDLLTSASVPGFAMYAGVDPPLGTIIGKAFEPLSGKSGVILMLVMLR